MSEWIVQSENRKNIHGKVKEEIIRCKDCWWYINVHCKQDGSEDKRYSPSFCEFHRDHLDSNNFCSFAIRRIDSE